MWPYLPALFLFSSYCIKYTVVECWHTFRDAPPILLILPENTFTKNYVSVIPWVFFSLIKLPIIMNHYNMGGLQCYFICLSYVLICMLIFYLKSPVAPAWVIKECLAYSIKTIKWTSPNFIGYVYVSRSAILFWWSVSLSFC